MIRSLDVIWWPTVVREPRLTSSLKNGMISKSGDRDGREFQLSGFLARFSSVVSKMNLNLKLISGMPDIQKIGVFCEEGIKRAGGRLKLPPNAGSILGAEARVIDRALHHPPASFF